MLLELFLYLKTYFFYNNTYYHYQVSYHINNYKKGRIINVIKYRSVNKDGTENRLKATSLDALPEAINLLIGNMSIVGPKPYKIVEKERPFFFLPRIFHYYNIFMSIFQYFCVILFT